MKTMIYCEPTQQGVHSIWLQVARNTFVLARNTAREFRNIFQEEFLLMIR